MLGSQVDVGKSKRPILSCTPILYAFDTLVKVYYSLSKAVVIMNEGRWN